MHLFNSPPFSCLCFFSSIKATPEKEARGKQRRALSPSTAEEEPPWTLAEGCGNRKGNKGQSGSAAAASGSSPLSVEGSKCRRSLLRWTPAAAATSMYKQRAVAESNSTSRFLRRRCRSSAGMAGEGSCWWKQAAVTAVEERAAAGLRHTACTSPHLWSWFLGSDLPKQQQWETTVLSWWKNNRVWLSCEVLPFSFFSQWGILENRNGVLLIVAYRRRVGTVGRESVESVLQNRKEIERSVVAIWGVWCGVVWSNLLLSLLKLHCLH